MRGNVWIGCAVAFTLCSIGVAAQTSSTASDQKKDTITVNGCLETGDVAGGTVGTTGSATTAGDHFKLTHAMTGTASTSSTTKPSTATSSTTGTSGSTYVLEGDSSDLRKHVNHQVEITGRLDMASSSTSTTSSTASSTMANAQKLRVESVKMISATCPH
jgi:hypothetical protein